MDLHYADGIAATRTTLALQRPLGAETQIWWLACGFGRRGSYHDVSLIHRRGRPECCPDSST
jgi:hypothetical protein